MKYFMVVLKPNKSDYFPYNPLTQPDWNVSFIADPQDLPSECDVLVLYEKIDKDIICECKIAIFVVGEPSDMRFYPSSFLSFFDFYVKSGVLSGSRQKSCFLALPCHLKREIELPKNNFVLHENTYPKSKQFSCISSRKTMTNGHVRRVKFIDKLIKSGVNIDYFGKGYDFIKDKSQGLNEYRFSIVIENKKENGYLTEKFTDAVIAKTIPIYYGCSRTASTIAPGAYIEMDIMNYDEALNLIRYIDGNASDIYEKMYYSLNAARNRIIHELSLPQNLIALIYSTHMVNLREGVRVSRLIKSPVNSIMYKMGSLMVRLRRVVSRFIVRISSI